MLGCTATQARHDPAGGWETTVVREDGSQVTVRSRCLVIATGATEDRERLSAAPIGSAPLLPRFAVNHMLSSDLIRDGGPEAVLQRLAGCPQPKIAIAGGSHSALSCALRLIDCLGDRLEPGAVTILHRRPLKLTYQTPAAAQADGYGDFGPEDICGKTGRVLPLGGFRADARDLLRRLWGLGGAALEGRVQLVRCDRLAPDRTDALLQGADLVISALGYRPNVLPLYDRLGDSFALRVERKAGALVDERSRIVAADGNPVPDAFALGLSAGYPLSGRHGETSFRGEANGLALWQSEIAAEIAEQIVRAGHG